KRTEGTELPAFHSPRRPPPRTLFPPARRRPRAGVAITVRPCRAAGGGRRGSGLGGSAGAAPCGGGAGAAAAAGVAPRVRLAAGPGPALHRPAGAAGPRRLPAGAARPLERGAALLGLWSGWRGGTGLPG